MRHHNRNKKLGRVKRQRTALVRSLAHSLVLHGAIVTTISKAKALRPFMERLITESKKNTLVSHRRVSSQLGNSPAITRQLHDVYAARYVKRQGGYVRMVKLGRIGKRTGEMIKIELV